MKLLCPAFLCALLVSAALVNSQTVFAGQARDNNTAGGLQARVSLKHRVIIPEIIYFRVGSAGFGDVDKVKFDVTPGGLGSGNNQSYSGTGVPIGDGTVLNATSNGVLTVYLYANVGTINISYAVSNPLGLSDGSGNYIPYSEIDVQSSSPGLPTPNLDNAGGPPGSANSVNVAGNLYGGLVTQRRATWTYKYLNNNVPPAGTYNGKVRYTAAAP